MNQIQCNDSPMKEQLKQHINEISDVLQQSLHKIDDESHCILSELEAIQDRFRKAESIAASFYLQCYLSAFSIQYLELSIAVNHLSQRRHGALIVIQRNDAIEAHLHNGISVGAKVSYSLLESIFYPGNPLHDGAVFISYDHIVSAANVLPLSATIASNKKLGTRHRAAIGITERTDALALVVSEETGQSSFAYMGKLYPINMGDVTE
ncbi:sporulation-specific diadenylate cyclase CdaS [Paenibacillus qinlingensis]|uniref:sporulation-specific diadenylate cyclase CdaS n=1 Tax=Paenibacillus qinlingensis TaxID=1837343 RepID=UPI0015652C92|nr:sporulation-specific diadenylate cyclase CdaS [Paenibacillus qinlingensis]NQX63619.1 DNA integrity scanning protein DisA nucleotide-binding domain protein [Paenibacillus qinlingensis]